MYRYSDFPFLFNSKFANECQLGLVLFYRFIAIFYIYLAFELLSRVKGLAEGPSSSTSSLVVLGFQVPLIRSPKL